MKYYPATWGIFIRHYKDAYRPISVLNVMMGFVTVSQLVSLQDFLEPIKNDSFSISTGAGFRTSTVFHHLNFLKGSNCCAC